MKALYFPFTYVPESVGKALTACFGQTTVYQISGAKVPDDMQTMAAGGMLDIRIPVNINGEMLDKIYEDHRTWINTHQGTEIAFLKTMAHNIPFFNKDASSQIRAEIKKTARQIPSREHPDSLSGTGLFLHMAQEYDIQNDGLRQDLLDIDAMEAGLMKDLKGEDDIQSRTAGYATNETKDPGRYMTTERIAAWASLMLKDPRDFGLLVTTSRAVLEHIVDILPEANQIIRFDAVPVEADKDGAWASWRNEFITFMEMLATHTQPAAVDDMAGPPEISGIEGNVSLTLYIIPDKTARECFTGFVDADILQDDSTKTGACFKNTLVGLVEKK